MENKILSRKILRKINLIFVITFSVFMIMDKNIFGGEYFHFNLFIRFLIPEIVVLTYVLSYIIKKDIIYQHILYFSMWLITIFATDAGLIFNQGKYISIYIIMLTISVFCIFKYRIMLIFIVLYTIMVYPVVFFIDMDFKKKIFVLFSMTIMLIFGEIKRKLNVQIMREYEFATNSKQQILKNSKEAFVLHKMIYDADGNAKDYEYIDVNRAFEELIGKNKSEVIGKRVLELYPDTEKSWISFYDKVLREKIQIKKIDYSKCLDRYIEIAAYPVCDNVFASLASDVTDRVNKEKKLEFAVKRAEKADKLKVQFLRDANHRLRTPLNGMMGMLQLINLDDIGEDNKELFIAMSLEMRNNRNIINEIAKYVEIQEMEFQYSWFDLKMLLELEIKKNKVAGKQINFEIQAGKDGNPVFFDKKIVAIIFNEVLNNALNYTNNGQVDIHVSIDMIGSDSTVVYKIKIKDYGYGIPKENIDYIFNEFYHSDFINIYKEADNLNLAKCKQLLKNSGGDIYVESQYKEGAIFTIVLPFLI